MPIVSGDGRYLLFGSTALNLATQPNEQPIAQPRPGRMGIFLRDRQQGSNLIVSVDPQGILVADDDSFPTGVSTNGQYALFESSSTNLVTGYNNQTSGKNIFFRDLVNNNTTLVSAGLSSNFGNGDSYDSSMTPDGRYVVFTSEASNLVADDTNGIADVFVRDMQTGVMRLVSVGARSTSLAFNLGSVSASDGPLITPDGQFVVFMSTATNLLPNVGTVGEVYVRDLVNNTTTCASTNAHKSFSGSIICYDPKISDDGQIVAFAACYTSSPISALIFRHHLKTGTDDISPGKAAPGSRTSYKDAVVLDASADGRFVAYVGWSNGYFPVFVWDSQAGTVSNATIGTNGTAVVGFGNHPIIDATGHYLSFTFLYPGLTTNVVDPSSEHLYWRDLQSGITKLVDVGLSGSATNRTQIQVENIGMSANGKFVLFGSPDADFVASDLNLASDVFACDMINGTTELVSACDPSLAFAKMGSTRRNASISADGQWAAFCGVGNGWVPDYTNRYRGVFVRDLVHQTNCLVSADTNGFCGADGGSTEAMMSGDGRYVIFTSFADNLVPNDTNHVSDVFRRDLLSGTTVLVSANTNNTGSMVGNSVSPSISFDGRYALFVNDQFGIVFRDCFLNTNFFLGSGLSPAVTMTPDGRYVAFSIGTSSVYVWDSQAKQRIDTNTASSGIFGLGISTNGQWLAAVGSTGAITISDRLARTNRNITKVSRPVSIRPGMHFSGDANAFVYATVAAQVSGDTNKSQDVYVYDWQANTNYLVSRSYYNSQAANGSSDGPDISADGRYVVYESTASDIVPNDANSVKDVFLYDRQAGMTTLLSVGSANPGTANWESYNPIFTADGMTTVFQSWASDIIDNDSNQGSDIFSLKLYSTNSTSGTNPPPVFPGQLIFMPSPSQSGLQNPRLAWTAQPGVAYQVQYKDNLSDAEWQVVQGSVGIEGAQGSVIDFVPNPDHRFYRIVPY